MTGALLAPILCLQRRSRLAGCPCFGSRPLNGNRRIPIMHFVCLEQTGRIGRQARGATFLLTGRFRGAARGRASRPMPSRRRQPEDFRCRSEWKPTTSRARTDQQIPTDTRRARLVIPRRSVAPEPADCSPPSRRSGPTQRGGFGPGHRSSARANPRTGCECTTWHTNCR